MKITDWINFGYLLIFMLCFSSCQHDHSSHATDVRNTGAIDETAVINEVELTNEQLANIGVEYGSIELRTIKSLVKLNGRVELPPLGKAVVGSSLDGKITHIYTQPGRSVKKGQKLFTLENLSIIDWQKDYEKENAELVYLNKELARQKSLSDDQIAPVKNYESTLAKIQQTKATLKGLKSKLESIGIFKENTGSYQSYFSVFAPSSGVVQHLTTDMGAYVTAGMPLADIINNSNLHLHLYAFGGDLYKLEKGQTINFFVHSNPKKIMEAKIFWINSIVNDNNNSYDVHAEILNGNQGLISGEFVEARVINQEQIIRTLPLESVTNDKGLKYIFVKEEVHEDAIHFLKVQVDIGESDLGFVEILPIDPIPDDAEVVIEGAFFLMAQSKKGEEGAGGHSH